MIQRRALAALPALLLGTILLACWPGYLSFDAAYQWQQARSGVYGDIAPPMLPFLWSLLLALGLPHTSGPLLLIGGLHAFGFARLAVLAHADGRPLLARLLALAGPCCPLLVLLLPHVWTDLLLSGALLAAMAVLLDPPLRLRSHLALAVLLLIACGTRHNALLAALPLLWWWARQWLPQASTARVLMHAGALLLALWLGKSALSLSLGIARLDTWAVTPMFDLQAVSVASGQQQLPAGLVGEGMDVQQLREAFDPYSATRLFSGTRSGVRNPTITALDPAQRQQLRQLWLALPLDRHWWSHRWRLFRGLLGSHRDPALRGLADNPALSTHADNPPLSWTYPTIHQHYRTLIELLRAGWWYAPALYLLLGLAAAGHAVLRRRRQPAAESGRWHAGSILLLLSAWLYTLPYFLLAPSAETRYLLWPALASWLLLCIQLGQLRRGSPAAADAARATHATAASSRLH